MEIIHKFVTIVAATVKEGLLKKVQYSTSIPGHVGKTKIPKRKSKIAQVFWTVLFININDHFYDADCNFENVVLQSCWHLDLIILHLSVKGLPCYAGRGIQCSNRRGNHRVIVNLQASCSNA